MKYIGSDHLPDPLRARRPVIRRFSLVFNIRVSFVAVNARDLHGESFVAVIF